MGSWAAGKSESRSRGPLRQADQSNRTNSPQQTSYFSRSASTASSWSTAVGGAIRTWYDGVGHALVSELIPGLHGDFNGDNVVDAADYTVWRNNLGTNNVLLNDPFGGTITQDQYDVWKQNFGAALPQDFGAGAGRPTVPAPSTLGLAASMVFAWAATMRQNRRKWIGQVSAAA